MNVSIANGGHGFPSNAPRERLVGACCAIVPFIERHRVERRHPLFFSHSPPFVTTVLILFSIQLSLISSKSFIMSFFDFNELKIRFTFIKMVFDVDD